MYGNLREIDLRSWLEFIELTQRTGQLLIDPNNSHERGKHSCGFWLLFFSNGQITYAVSSTNFHLQRLQDYLRRYQVESSLEQLIPSPSLPSSLTQNLLPEYDYLWLLLEHQIITRHQAQRILYNLVKEVLFDILGLRQGEFILQSNAIVQPILPTIEISPVVKQVTWELQQWKQLYPYITSPEQRPLLTQPKQLQQALTHSAYRSLSTACQGKLSLRRLARHLNQDLLTISRALYPHIQRGWFQLLVAQGATATQQRQQVNQASVTSPRVVCIHQESEVADYLQDRLKAYGYDPIVFQDPIAAVSDILQVRPDFVFAAFKMSTLTGEQLANLLYRLPNWKTPPVILISRDRANSIDVARAKLLGIQAILTQPLQESELANVLQVKINN